MDEFEILRNDKDNYRITSKNQDGFTFYITKLKGHLKGIAYNDSSSVGYKINYSKKAGELVFQETDKSELRYTCGSADHSHHDEEVEKPPLQFKPLAPSTDVKWGVTYTFQKRCVLMKIS